MGRRPRGRRRDEGGRLQRAGEMRRRSVARNPRCGSQGRRIHVHGKRCRRRLRKPARTPRRRGERQGSRCGQSSAESRHAAEHTDRRIGNRPACGCQKTDARGACRPERPRPDLPLRCARLRRGVRRRRPLRRDRPKTAVAERRRGENRRYQLVRQPPRRLAGRDGHRRHRVARCGALPRGHPRRRPDRRARGPRRPRRPARRTARPGGVGRSRSLQRQAQRRFRSRPRRHAADAGQRPETRGDAPHNDRRRQSIRPAGIPRCRRADRRI